MHITCSTRQFSQSRLPPSPGPVAGPGKDVLEPSGGLLRKVLVVDDEADLADVTALLLSTHGLEVVVAYSAYEALNILASDSKIDAIFSDIVMPGMTGLELAEAVRERYPRLKIVLASGFTLPSLVAKHAPSYLYTPKPYRIDTVLKLLYS